MKMYGDGLGKLENITLDIAETLTTDLKDRCDGPVGLEVPLRSAMANVISSIVSMLLYVRDPTFPTLLGLPTSYVISFRL